MYVIAPLALNKLHFFRTLQHTVEKKKCGNDCHGHGCGESVASGGGGGETTIFFPSILYYTTYLAGDFLSEVGEVHLSGWLLLTAVTPVFHH